jgi:hypothetical protein
MLLCASIKLACQLDRCQPPQTCQQQQEQKQQRAEAMADLQQLHQHAVYRSRWQCAAAQRDGPHGASAVVLVASAAQQLVSIGWQQVLGGSSH